MFVLSDESREALEPSFVVTYHEYLRSLRKFPLSSADRKQLQQEIELVAARRIKLGNRVS